MPTGRSADRKSHLVEQVSCSVVLRGLGVKDRELENLLLEIIGSAPPFHISYVAYNPGSNKQWEAIRGATANIGRLYGCVLSSALANSLANM